MIKQEVRSTAPVYPPHKLSPGEPKPIPPHNAQPTPPPDQWMSALPDNLLISDIHIPGAHNAAAIHTSRRTRWACQDRSITHQLQEGIRLLDVRLKPKKSPRTRIHKDSRETVPAETPNTFHFVTCHGRLGLFGANEFQPFESLQQECTAFLEAHPRETIIMTIQIDDYRHTPDPGMALRALSRQLAPAPYFTQPHLPTLGELRGQLYLINRINDDATLGVPLHIPDNTPGITLEAEKNRQYELFVQDQYKALDRRNPETHKLRLTVDAFQKKRPGTALLNFASATKPLGQLLSINDLLLAHLDARLAQPQGWLLLDYATGNAIPSRLIAANFQESR